MCIRLYSNSGSDVNNLACMASHYKRSDYTNMRSLPLLPLNASGSMSSSVDFIKQTSRPKVNSVEQNYGQEKNENTTL